jgi:hypothetical protein
MTDIPGEDVDAALRSPQLALFLFQFSDYSLSNTDAHRRVRPKEKVF